MASSQKKKKYDDAAKAAANTAFNTATRNDPVPKNPNEGLGAKKKAKPEISQRELYRHVYDQKKLHSPVTRVQGTAALAKGAGMSFNGPKAPATEKATPAPKPRAKPATAAPKPATDSFKNKNAEANRKLGKAPASKTMAYTAPGTQKRGNVFSGKNDPMGPRKDASGKNASYGFASVKDLLRGKRAK